MGVPKFLESRPKQFVDQMLNKMDRVTDENVSSVVDIGNNRFTVRSDSSNQIYKVYFGNENEFCDCSCDDFRRNRLLCKHFFSVIRRGFRCFTDITPLFINHPYTTLDNEVLGISQDKNETVNIVNDDSDNDADVDESDESDGDNGDDDDFPDVQLGTNSGKYIRF